MSAKPIFQVRAELHGYKPLIWRSFLVEHDVTMEMFSYIIMTLFEMDASHLFCFNVPVLKNLKIRVGKTKSEDKDIVLQKFEELTEKKNLRLEILSEFSDDFMGSIKVLDLRDVKLVEVFAKKGEKATFNYDFGDDWLINLKIEKVITGNEFDEKELPCVLAGEGLGIIEDCGGVGGLSQIVEAFEEGSGDKYDEYVEWLGVTDLDLTFFDIEDANSRLKDLPSLFDGELS